MVLVALMATPALAEGDAERGRLVFATCTPCHGATGRGNVDVKAPAIAGLPVWYVGAQLEKFRGRARGNHPDDAEGLRMAPMSRSLRVEESGRNDVADVAAYVASLPREANEGHVEGGDAEAGKRLYTTCIACHGPDGGGSQPVNGPPLKKQDDWYLVEQIHKFRAGIRGGDPARDPTGAIMRAMSGTLPDEQAIKDVVAYIRTLD